MSAEPFLIGKNGFFLAWASDINNFTGVETSCLKNANARHNHVVHAHAEHTHAALDHVILAHKMHCSRRQARAVRSIISNVPTTTILAKYVFRWISIAVFQFSYFS